MNQIPWSVAPYLLPFMISLLYSLSLEDVTLLPFTARILEGQKRVHRKAQVLWRSNPSFALCVWAHSEPEFQVLAKIHNCEPDLQNLRTGWNNCGRNSIFLLLHQLLSLRLCPALLGRACLIRVALGFRHRPHPHPHCSEALVSALMMPLLREVHISHTEADFYLLKHHYIPIRYMVIQGMLWDFCVVFLISSSFFIHVCCFYGNNKVTCSPWPLRLFPDSC